jgi:hypothetical protein
MNTTMGQPTPPGVGVGNYQPTPGNQFTPIGQAYGGAIQNPGMFQPLPPAPLGNAMAQSTPPDYNSQMYPGDNSNFNLPPYPTYPYPPNPGLVNPNLGPAQMAQGSPVEAPNFQMGGPMPTGLNIAQYNQLRRG